MKYSMRCYIAMYHTTLYCIVIDHDTSYYSIPYRTMYLALHTTHRALYTVEITQQRGTHENHDQQVPMCVCVCLSLSLSMYIIYIYICTYGFTTHHAPYTVHHMGYTSPSGLNQRSMHTCMYICTHTHTTCILCTSTLHTNSNHDIRYCMVHLHMVHTAAYCSMLYHTT